MKAHELNVTSKKDGIRPGRGIAAGRGKTAGRGTKGQNSRAGGKRRPGFEGGQNPIFKRLPKARGFNSHRTGLTTITTGQIADLGAKVNNQTLLDAGLIDDLYIDVKVVTKGEMSKAQSVQLAAASQSAIAMIEKAGGSFESAGRAQRPKSEKTKKTD